MLVFLVIMLLIGAVPCLIGFIFLKHSLGDRWTAALIARVPTSPASAVASMRPGQLVEVKGTLRCPEPLRSELTGRPCAYFRTWVERSYEYEDRDVNDEPRTTERTEILRLVRGTGAVLCRGRYRPRPVSPRTAPRSARRTSTTGTKRAPPPAR